MKLFPNLFVLELPVELSRPHLESIGEGEPVEGSGIFFHASLLAGFTEGGVDVEVHGCTVTGTKGVESRRHCTTCSKSAG